jgi:hypothetical protein
MSAAWVSLKSEWKAFGEQLDDLSREQLPYATARALTETARAVQRTITAELPSIFDRPTPFTMRALAIKPARKSDLTAEVFVKDIQAAYLKLEETGGTRTPKRTALVLPADIRLNQYGNIPRAALQRLKGRGKAAVFVGTVKGVGGFWQRGPLHSLRLLAAFKPAAQYKPRFHYRDRVAAAARAAFPPSLERNLTLALATARPRGGL